MAHYLEVARRTLGAMQSSPDANQQNGPQTAAAPSEQHGIPWTEWKAAALNRLFQEQGATGQPGRITAETVRHGEAVGKRVDSAGTDERPMSGAEATK